MRREPEVRTGLLALLLGVEFLPVFLGVQLPPWGEMFFLAGVCLLMVCVTRAGRHEF